MSTQEPIALSDASFVRRENNEAAFIVGGALLAFHLASALTGDWTFALLGLPAITAYVLAWVRMRDLCKQLENVSCNGGKAP